MADSIVSRSFLTLHDFTPTEIRELLDLAHQLKNEQRNGEFHQRFAGKTLALLFEKRSTRTRCAFETAFGEEGGHPVFLSRQDIHLGAKETIADTARVLGRMFNCIQFRGYKQETANTLAEFSGVPVYNGLTDSFHPTQVLADLMTLEENLGAPAGRKLTYVGDGRNNVAVSLLVGCAKLGVHCTIVAPQPLMPSQDVMDRVSEYAVDSKSIITCTSDADAGVQGADVVYTDVWTSMGEEARESERERLLLPYQVNDRLLDQTGNPDVIFMHCLPAVRGKEVTNDVLDGPRSRAWDEAENRKHTIKAVMLATLGI